MLLNISILLNDLPQNTQLPITNTYFCVGIQNLDQSPCLLRVAVSTSLII